MGLKSTSMVSTSPEKTKGRTGAKNYRSRRGSVAAHEKPSSGGMLEQIGVTETQFLLCREGYQRGDRVTHRLTLHNN
ncbi:hypothetical protein MRB53_025989 [Persea americana]|uniref:Uncharacterized protein n=1 Tax=Persea americana TaxID=3435 RepID=A0ACC2LHQ4_PERAE|nr:hypothetical protein MRB53_025989 [Persea americana]